VKSLIHQALSFALSSHPYIGLRHSIFLEFILPVLYIMHHPFCRFFSRIKCCIAFDFCYKHNDHLFSLHLCFFFLFHKIFMLSLRSWTYHFHPRSTQLFHSSPSLPSSITIIILYSLLLFRFRDLFLFSFFSFDSFPTPGSDCIHIMHAFFFPLSFYYTILSPSLPLQFHT
jgi:hypothetical protein